MAKLNNFTNYRRAIKLLLARPDKCLVFNSRIGWVVTGEHTRSLESDIARLSRIDIKMTAIESGAEPESVETWANLTTKHNIND